MLFSFWIHRDWMVEKGYFEHKLKLKCLILEGKGILFDLYHCVPRDGGGGVTMKEFYLPIHQMSSQQ